MRPIDGVGVELRYQWDGELRVSQMFKAWAELEATATEKRQELEARAGTQRRRCAILRVSDERRGPFTATDKEGMMLFYVGWKAREGHGPEEGDKSLELFTRWKPPQALQMNGMWARADGGGFCICEASSAEVVFEACAPWADVLLDYDIIPIVEVEKAVELLKKAIAFRKG